MTTEIKFKYSIFGENTLPAPSSTLSASDGTSDAHFNANKQLRGVTTVDIVDIDAIARMNVGIN